MTDYLNSPFGSAFISSLAGALLGALSAILYGRNALLRKERLDSLRSASNGLVLAWSCADIAMSLKSQHVRSMVRKYRAQQEAAEKAHECSLTSGASSTHIVEADMLKLSPVTLPLEALKNFVYSMNHADAKCVSAVSMIEASLSELNHVIEMRSGIIDEFRSAKPDSDTFACKYLGLINADGSVDSLYASTIEAIGQYTDDLIFFCVFLGENLKSHSDQLRKSLDSWREQPMKNLEVDFSPARATGLVPENGQYIAWLRGFGDVS